MNEWISFEKRWPLPNHKVTVKMGDRREIAMLVNRRMLFADQEKMRSNPPTEEVTHWKPGRWLPEGNKESTVHVQHNEWTQTSLDYTPKKRKLMSIDGLKCECGHPEYLHIISIETNGQANVACKRYIYTRGEDGCSGITHEGKIVWKEEEPANGKEFGFTGAFTK